VDFLADDFFCFSDLAEHVSEEDEGGWRDLNQLLFDWIDQGDAVELSGGDFSQYLLAVISIRIRLEQDSYRLKQYHKPLLRPECNALDPGFWRAEVFRRQLGLRTGLTDPPERRHTTT
jgi:hypothetical protein